MPIGIENVLKDVDMQIVYRRLEARKRYVFDFKTAGSEDLYFRVTVSNGFLVCRSAKVVGATYLHISQAIKFKLKNSVTI